jgi:hypothetical protein
MSISMQDNRTAIVVAHPDDEALWLSGALAKAGQFIFCYGDPFQRPKLAAARRRAVAALPLNGLVDLQIPESGAGFSVDWPLPRMTEFGVAINEPQARQRYEANFLRLVNELRPLLANCGQVYTHNPWGEYGHAEHLQVYRAVALLQAELGFTLWFSNYVGKQNVPLARHLASRIFWVERSEHRPDAEFGRRLMRIYGQAGAWTWTRLHRWPRLEVFYACRPGAPAGTFARRSLAGEWLLDIGSLRWWPAPWRNPRQLL